MNGNSENAVEDCLDAISEIGHKIEIKLKETVFRSKFSDLKRSEYLRQTELKAVCESCESLVVNNCHFCLKVTPIHPSRVNSPITEINESPLGLMDSELDLLDIMSTWPELFRKTDSTVSQSVRKSVGQSVRKSLKREIPVVNNDLFDQDLQIQLIQPEIETSIETPRKYIKNVNFYQTNVKLFKIKCFTEEYYASSGDLKRSVKILSESQCHLVENFNVDPEISSRGELEHGKENNRLNSDIKTLPKNKSPTKKVKAKTKRKSPVKPLKLKAFLEKIKAKKKLDSPKCPNTPQIDNLGCETLEHHVSVVASQYGDLDSENGCLNEFSNPPGKIRTKNVPNLIPNRQKISREV